MNSRAALACACAVAAPLVHAQSRDSIPPASRALHRAAIGFGTNSLGWPYGTTGFGFSFSYAYQPSELAYIVRAMDNVSEFKLFDVPDVELWEAALMVGKGEYSHWWSLTYAGGLCFEGTLKHGARATGGGWFSPSYTRVNTLGVGVVAEVQGIAILLPFLGIGATVTGSLNTTRPYLTMMGMLVFGALRRDR